MCDFRDSGHGDEEVPSPPLSLAHLLEMSVTQKKPPLPFFSAFLSKFFTLPSSSCGKRDGHLSDRKEE